MKKLNVLYISGSLGLGHITRDIAITNKLRELIPEVDIEWLAAHPATAFLLELGEKLVEGAENYSNENVLAEKAAKGANLNLINYLMKAGKAWDKNTKVFTKVVTNKKYDLVIGDETYEISLALREHPEIRNFKFVMIFDFVGMDSMSQNPFEKLGVHIYNSKWSHNYRKKIKPSYDLGLFVGELEDIPDKSFGFNLPNRREFAKAMYKFVGYIFPFDVEEYKNQSEVRKKLGYDDKKLVIASIGGTSIGKELLELCGETFPLVKARIPEVRFILVTGPRLRADSVKVPEGVEVREFIPKLYEHFAASDLAIVQGGATSTLELTALKKPFLYFPLEGHCEQANVARILSQRGAGIKMLLSQTTPVLLAEKMISTIVRPVSYPNIPSDGAQKAAEEILKVLN